MLLRFGRDVDVRGGGWGAEAPLRRRTQPVAGVDYRGGGARSRGGLLGALLWGFRGGKGTRKRAVAEGAGSLPFGELETGINGYYRRNREVRLRLKIPVFSCRVR